MWGEKRRTDDLRGFYFPSCSMLLSQHPSQNTSTFGSAVQSATAFKNAIKYSGSVWLHLILCTKSKIFLFLGLHLRSSDMPSSWHPDYFAGFAQLDINHQRHVYVQFNQTATTNCQALQYLEKKILKSTSGVIKLKKKKNNCQLRMRLTGLKGGSRGRQKSLLTSHQIPLMPITICCRDIWHIWSPKLHLPPGTWRAHTSPALSW